MNTRIVKNTHGTAAEALLSACQLARMVNSGSYREPHKHGCACRRCSLANVLDAAIAQWPSVPVEAELQRLAAEVPPQDAQTKKVVVIVDGGMVSEVTCPPGVEVEVRDYDVEGFVQCGDTEDLRTDAQGYRYARGIWRHGDDSEGELR